LIGEKIPLIRRVTNFASQPVDPALYFLTKIAGFEGKNAIFAVLEPLSSRIILDNDPRRVDDRIQTEALYIDPPLATLSGGSRTLGVDGGDLRLGEGLGAVHDPVSV
jgi:hypothetical protein